MYPWLWFWAPQVHFPWSGDVAQRIQPNTRWFFEGIPPGAGDADIEEKAFAVASYGKQLGLITEILIELAEHAEHAEHAENKSALAATSLERLKRIRAQIEQIKSVEYTARSADIEAQVTELKRKGGREYAELTEKLLPLLGRDGQ